MAPKCMTSVSGKRRGERSADGNPSKIFCPSNHITFFAAQKEAQNRVSMASQIAGFEPFAILTPRLILIPTPLAVNFTTYRTLYSELHADVNFCQMAFGGHFPARNWSNDQTREVIETRDIGRSWKRYAIGDFAVGLRPSSRSNPPNDQNKPPSFSLLKGDELENLVGPNMARLDRIKWVGYAGVRDACTTSLPAREADDPPLPPWQEMVEIRYGISPQFWGGGIAPEAARAVMQWAVAERGVKRFIAETEKHNTRSAGLLQKVGFVASGTDYWKEPSEMEWELVVKVP